MRRSLIHRLLFWGGLAGSLLVLVGWGVSTKWYIGCFIKRYRIGLIYKRVQIRSVALTGDPKEIELYEQRFQDTSAFDVKWGFYPMPRGQYVCPDTVPEGPWWYLSDFESLEIVSECEARIKGTGIGARVTVYEFPLWLVFLCFAIPTAVTWWHRRRAHDKGHCRECGYNMTGNVTGRCPECGAPWNEDSSISIRSPIRTLLKATSLAACFALLAVIFVQSIVFGSGGGVVLPWGLVRIPFWTFLLTASVAAAFLWTPELLRLFRWMAALDEDERTGGP